MGDGFSYRGTRATTEKGLRCQHWQATTPHDHRCPRVPGCSVAPTLGSMGQWGMGWEQCGIVQEQWGQPGGNGIDRRSAPSWLCPLQGKRFLAALLPTLLPAGFCHPPAMGWRRITAETLTGTSGARGVTPLIPMSGTRAAA